MMIKSKKLKLTLGIFITAAIVVGSICILNNSKNKDTKEIVDEQVINKDNNEIEEKAEEKVEELSAKIEENKDVEKLNENTKNNVNDNVKVERVEQKNNLDEENMEVKNSKDIYTSQGLGISFNIPDTWANKYSIKDNGEEVSIYMKRKVNTNAKDECLCVITSKLDAYDNGNKLDSVYDMDKIITVNGKKYLAGIPLSCNIAPNESDMEQYLIMIQQVSDIFNTIR